MKDSLVVGIEHETHHCVTPDMAPPHLPVAVLSTPSMIHLIEMTCLEAAQPHLDDGETTVGTHVCVSHSGAARAGEDVRFQCALQAVDGRRLTFAVEVSTSARSISEGTHQRVVIDRSRFAGS
jgi:fluoroacetyl-CoA thioesterase